MLLFGTALCWGSSFAFIKIAVEDGVHPLLLMVLRCTIGAVLLWIAVFWMRARTRRIDLQEGRVARPHARHWPHLLANGVMTGVPLFLMGVGERSVDSGLAGVANASVPLWAALLAVRWDAQHRTTATRWVGAAIGFVGVVLLIAVRGSIGGSGESGGLLAIAAAAFIYAVSGIYTRERLNDVPSVEVAAWAVTWGAALFAVPAFVFWTPSSLPSTAALVSILLLGVLGTFGGFLLYYELLHRVGAARATLVTYLMPPMALVYGALLLNEPTRPESLVALALILVGVWIGSRGTGGVDVPATGLPLPSEYPTAPQAVRSRAADAAAAPGET